MFTRNRIIIAIVIALAVFAIYRKYQAKTVSGENNKGFVVFGTDWCGYTTKQRKHLDSKYGANSHTYVNCEVNKGACKNMDGFPVTKTPEGNMVVGFNSTL